MPLALRLVDISGPFVDQSAPVRNWSSFPFNQIDIPSPPYVDQARLQRGVEHALAYLDAVQAQGYTGIVIDNLAHLVTFDQAPRQYYTPDSPFRLRALAYRQALWPLLTEAAKRGMQVYVTTDMQWMTSELRKVAGALTADNPRLTAINQAAFIDLFSALPMVQGVIIRIGETGGAHDIPGYTGHLLYHDVATIRHLIATLLPVCVTFDRHLVIRTWTLGIGEAGDLISSPARYAAVFADQYDPHLLVSIKHTPADFFRFLPPNPTLDLPGPRQLVEVQNRREYELFGLVPAGVVHLHSAAIRRAATSPQCVGIWAWNSTGGWGGGGATLGPNGWNLWTEASSAVTAALARQPDIDAEAFVRTWFAQRLANYSPPFAEAVATAYLISEQLIEEGWYFGRLPALTNVKGMVTPSLLWVWWMHPTAALPVWIYLAESLTAIQPVINRTEQAVQQAQRLRDHVTATAPSSDPLAQQIVTSLEYLHDVLTIAWRTRAFLLPLAAAVKLRQHPVLDDAAQALAAAIQHHREHWGKRTDFPPLELDELTDFLATWQHSPALIWHRTKLAAWIVTLLRRQSAGVARIGPMTGALLPPQVRRHLLQTTLPWLSRRLNLLPAIFFETGPAIGEWAR